MTHREKRSGIIARVALILVCTNVFAGNGSAAGGGHYVTVEPGVRIHYDVLGSGVPIFMIAGGPGANSSRFRYTHSLLKPLGKLVYIDNRGRGRSTEVKAAAPGANTYSLEADVMDVEAVRRALEAERIIIYGHSYGSMVAMAYASRFPQHTLALCTTSGIHGARVWQERNIDVVKRFLANHYPKRWARIVALRDAGHLTGQGELADLFQGIEELYAYNPESEQRLHAQFEDFKDRKSTLFNPEVYRAMVGADPEWTIGGTLAAVELLPELRNYTGPALIMGGRFDRICPPINQVEIADALPGARLVIFEKSGHAPFIEEPLRFLTVFSGFLEEVIPPGTRPKVPRSQDSANDRNSSGTSP